MTVWFSKSLKVLWTSGRKQMGGLSRGSLLRRWSEDGLSHRPAHIGVRTDRYKLIFLYGEPLGMTGSSDVPVAPSWEFYDLLEDPHEDRNAYSDKRYQTVIRKMKQEMMRLRNECGDMDEGAVRISEILAAEGLL